MRELESSRRDNTDMRVRNLVNTQVNNPFIFGVNKLSLIIVKECLKITWFE